MIKVPRELILEIIEMMGEEIGDDCYSSLLSEEYDNIYNKLKFFIGENND